MRAMDLPRQPASRELVLIVFPELRFGGDRDVERYFELRKAGRLREALAVYNGPLRARYPDDQARAVLLKLFREGDPRWLELQARLLEKLGEQLASRARANIDTIADSIAGLSLKNALAALSAAEALTGRLSSRRDPEEAAARVERYLGFARLLGHRLRELEHVRDLLGDYLALSRAESPDEQDFVARSLALEEKRRASGGVRGGADVSGRPREERVDFIARSQAREERRRQAEQQRAHYFDLSRLSFSAADRARIELDAEPHRHEDLVLAYCLKYWRAALDPAFERLIFLYSRKYGTRHYELYRAIRIGRLRRRDDDEILAALSSLLSARYSYSVSGDRYLQAAWHRLKAGLEGAEQREPGPASAKASATAVIAARTRPSHESPMPAPATASSSMAGQKAPASAPQRDGRQPAVTPRESAHQASRPSPIRKQEPEDRLKAVLATRTEQLRPTPPPLPPELRTQGRPLPHAERPKVERPEPTSRLAATPDGETARAPASRPETPQRPGRGPQEQKPAPGSTYRREEAGSARETTSAQPMGRAETKANSPELTPRSREGRRLAPLPRAPEALPEIQARGGSVSDRIKKLAGTKYDVYRNIFLKRVRDDIRRGLAASRGRKAGFFDTGLNEAEDLVYGFMEHHYDDPFMDWEGSEERRSLAALGYSLPSLDPLIEACFHRL